MISNGIESILTAEVTQTNVSMTFTCSKTQQTKTFNAETQACFQQPFSISVDLEKEQNEMASSEIITENKQNSFIETAVNDETKLIESYEMSNKPKCISITETKDTVDSVQTVSVPIVKQAAIDYENNLVENPITSLTSSVRVIDALETIPVSAEG